MRNSVTSLSFGVILFPSMPELAEIHSYARNINGWTHNVVFDEVVKNVTGKGPDLSLLVTWPFTIFAQARGKELKLTLTRVSSEQTLEATFRHGLVGIWEWAPKKSLPKHTHIYFSSSSTGHALWYALFRSIAQVNLNFASHSPALSIPTD